MITAKTVLFGSFLLLLWLFWILWILWRIHGIEITNAGEIEVPSKETSEVGYTLNFKNNLNISVDCIVREYPPRGATEIALLFIRKEMEKIVIADSVFTTLKTQVNAAMLSAGHRVVIDTLRVYIK